MCHSGPVATGLTFASTLRPSSGSRARRDASVGQGFLEPLRSGACAGFAHATHGKVLLCHRPFLKVLALCEFLCEPEKQNLGISFSPNVSVL
jgi:hypothetical protein